jgi:hypothetical protein
MDSERWRIGAGQNGLLYPASHKHNQALRPPTGRGTHNPARNVIQCGLRTLRRRSMLFCRRTSMAGPSGNTVEDKGDTEPPCKHQQAQARMTVRAGVVSPGSSRGDEGGKVIVTSSCVALA